MSGAWAIGIDGGGTKTAAVLGTAYGETPARRAESGPCNVAAMEPVDAVRNVRQAIDQLLLAADEIISICAGVAGYSATVKREQFLTLLQSAYPNTSVEVVPDYIIAHSSAFPDGDGVIVIAGTGSIAFGVNRRGETATAGGYGYLIDDSGTGYGLGRQVLVAASRTFDKVPGSEMLAQLFRDRTGVYSRQELIDAVYGGHLERAAIASLSTLVTEAAALGDPYSKSLLMHAGGALARLAQSAMSGLFSPSEVVPIAKAGSLWGAGGELDAVFVRSLVRAWPASAVSNVSVDPALGAFNRACRMMH